MPRFTKRPVTIDAVRWTGEMTQELLALLQSSKPGGVLRDFEGGQLIVETLEGKMRANPGDWIIRGVKGELYPCKSDIFDATYDAALDLTVKERSWTTKEGVEVSERGTAVGRPEDFIQPWEVYRCEQAAPEEACGIRELGIIGKRDVVSDTNREECCHNMRLVDANRIVELHNRQPLTVITIKGDMPPEQFAKFRKQWEASHAAVSRAMVFDSEVVDVKKLNDQLDAAWGIIANASGGDWKLQTQEWQDAAARWRDLYDVPRSGAHEFAEAWNEKARATSKIVDQPPPHNHPDMLPAWEKVIDDYRDQFGYHVLNATDEDPISVANANTVNAVLDDMRERDKTGREKYGVPLTPFNGRDQLVDAYQELLDAAVYIRAASLEGIPVPDVIYKHVLDDITFVRRMITERAKDPREL